MVFVDLLLLVLNDFAASDLVALVVVFAEVCALVSFVPPSHGPSKPSIDSGSLLSSSISGYSPYADHGDSEVVDCFSFLFQNAMRFSRLVEDAFSVPNPKNSTDSAALSSFFFDFSRFVDAVLSIPNPKNSPDSDAFSSFFVRFSFLVEELFSVPIPRLGLMLNEKSPDLEVLFSFFFQNDFFFSFFCFTWYSSLPASS